MRQAFNSKWAARLELFRRLNPPPHWAPGVPLDAALRARYEACLPVAEFLADLARVGRRVLPSPELLPLCLADAAARAGHDALGPSPFPSLPDLWSTLPETFAGRITFGDGDWLPLFCALADPPRFGTDFGRYPDQLAAIRNWLASPTFQFPISGFTILDLGCGTGQGTYELAATAAEEFENRQTKTGVSVHALGVTREPLEVWMAENRRLPHDPERERAFQRRTQNAECRTEIGKTLVVRFCVGDALAAPCDGPFDLVTANGLIGGRFLRTPQALERFLGEAERLLAPAGLLALANHFHEGERAALESFADSARRRGWRLAGSLDNSVLTRPRRPDSFF